MDWRKKVGLAAVVVGIGVAVALQFRKPPVDGVASGASAWTAPTSADQPHTVANADILPRSTPTFSGRIDSAPEPSPADSGKPGIETTAEPATQVRAQPSQPATLAPQAADLFARFNENNGRVQGSTAAGSRGLVELNAPDRKHTIADGDTLSSIARRYLGSETRSKELFESNRDVLRHPDMLPIGVELRIPSSVPIQSTDDSDSRQSAARAPLVPVGTAPAKAATAAPAAAKREAPRTYTVQAGDNLVDLARKLYGDGRRHEQLFEANRRVMRHPGDLKPGVVLTVP